MPLAQRLSAQGHELRVMSPGPLEDDVPWPVHIGWLEDPDAVRAAVEDCEVVVHNAAHFGPTFDPDEHARFVASNALGSANVFAAALSGEVRHVVLLSSPGVLGTGAGAEEFEAAGRARCVRDADPPDPRNIYDASKHSAESFAHFYREQHGLSVTILRPGWFARPEDLHDHEFTWRLLGPCVWVGDVIAAVLAAIEQPAQDELLIFPATPFTDDDAAELLADPAKAVARHFPDEMAWWTDQGLPTPAIRWWADIAPARERLGYAPKLNFPDAVARMREGKSPWPTAGLRIAR